MLERWLTRARLGSWLAPREFELREDAVTSAAKRPLDPHREPQKVLDRFSRRRLSAASSELHLAATAFNLRKIYRAAYC